jgi:hypothetical protein
MLVCSIRRSIRCLLAFTLGKNWFQVHLKGKDCWREKKILDVSIEKTFGAFYLKDVASLTEGTGKGCSVQNEKETF